jgi:hypothetical protein
MALTDVQKAALNRLISQGWASTPLPAQVIADAAIPLLAYAQQNGFDLEELVRNRLGLVVSPPPPPPPAPGKYGLLVPAYFSGSSPYWAQLATAAAKLPVIAVANPNNGPGASVSGSYTTSLTNFKNAGGTPLGYVYTGYGSRPSLEVKTDIDSWVRFYPMLRGIFFDEQAGGTSTLAWYKDLYAYARSKISGAVVVSNPGTPGYDEGYVMPGGADIVVSWEDAAMQGAPRAPSFASKYGLARFAALVYSAAESAMPGIIKSARTAGDGWVYVTGDTLSNPWDTLPTYLAGELTAAAAA